jgi:hypothetical protein
MAIEKFVNSCALGVEHAALDTAKTLGLEVGGVCPGNRTPPDGYGIQRWSSDPDIVARRNIEESHGTLVIFSRPIGEYESRSKNIARGMGKPCVLIDLADYHRLGKTFLEGVHSKLAGCRVVNITGPIRMDLYSQTRHMLMELFK